MIFFEITEDHMVIHPNSEGKILKIEAAATSAWQSKRFVLG
jgi:hypothetical protein